MISLKKVINMNKKCTELCLCPLEGVIDIVSKKWTLMIINSLGNHHKLRFNQLMRELDGVSPKTLSDTLKVLEREGLIKKNHLRKYRPGLNTPYLKMGWN